LAIHLKFHAAVLDEFESNTLSESLLLHEEIKKLNGTLAKGFIRKYELKSQVEDLEDIRVDYSVIRSEIISIGIFMNNTFKKYVEFCDLTIADSEMEIQKIRESIKHGFKRQQNKCKHQYKTRIPVIRRQLEDLQLIVDNIISDANKRRKIYY